MTHPPPRKRFQFHLSTAMVLMFVAGGLIWANTRARIFSHEMLVGMRRIMKSSIEFRGWPIDAYEKDITFIMWTDNQGNIHTPSPSVNPLHVTLDALIGIAMLISTWVICEYLIRRRAARKGA